MITSILRCTLPLVALCTLLPASEILTKPQIQQILQQNGKDEVGLSDHKNLLFCWSPADHPHGTHAYEAFANHWAQALNPIPHLNATAVKGFPSEEQWENADLVVFNLTQKSLTKQNYQRIDAHLAKGGSLMVLHQGIVHKKQYHDWAKRIGFAFSWEKGTHHSKWGRGPLEISLDTQHPIFAGFPAKVSIEDELYWNFIKGTDGQISTLGATTAPEQSKKSSSPEEPSDRLWPTFWTVQHTQDDGTATGRVFGCVIGHYDDVLFSDFLQLVMTRAYSWCLDLSPAAFQPALKLKQ